MPVIGKDLVLKNIDKFGKGFLNHVNKTMVKVEKIMDKQITKNISRTDHSLEDLAALGHPYSRRHGKNGMEIHNPYWQIHTQSGKLLSSKSSGTEPADITGGKLHARAFVLLDGSIAEHAYSVIYGTSRMIPRPALTGSLEQVRGKLFDLIEAKLKDAVHNFKAG